MALHDMNASDYRPTVII